VTGSVNTGGTSTDANGGPVLLHRPLRRGRASSRSRTTTRTAEQDPREPSDTADKTGPAQSTEGCKITYGGHITANGDFCFVGTQGPDKGNLYKDHGPAQPVTFKMPDVLAVLCSANDTHGTIFAETRDGLIARIDVQDLGEPGRNDTYRIQVSNGYDSGEQTLAQGGNIQIHH
jgi:hypothetical protein